MEIKITDAEYTDKYSQVCDIVERTYQNISLDEELPAGLTSKEARLAANKIFEIFGVYLSR